MRWFLKDGWKPGSSYRMHHGYSDEWPHWWEDRWVDTVRACKQKGKADHRGDLMSVAMSNPRFADMATDISLRSDDGLCEAEDNVRVDVQRCYGEDWRSLAESYENFVQLAFAVGEITQFMGQPSDELALDAPILAAHRWMPMADQAQ